MYNARYTLFKDILIQFAITRTQFRIYMMGNIQHEATI